MKTPEQVIYEQILKHGLDSGVEQDLAEFMARDFAKNEAFQTCLIEYGKEVLAHQESK